MLVIGLALFLSNGGLLENPSESLGKYVTYATCIGCGYLCLLTAGVWLGRLWSVSLMEDRYNVENESFQQETRLLNNDYSINLPTRFYYRKKWHDG